MTVTLWLRLKAESVADPGILRSAMRRATPVRSLRILALAVVRAAAVRHADVAVASTEALPQRLDDRTFWTLVTEFSEPSGIFRSDNLVSNEMVFQHVIPTLQETLGAGERLRRRRPGSELHLHRLAEAAHRLHRRHPAAEHDAAPDVQGADRDVADARGVPLAAVLAPDAGATAPPTTAPTRC